MKDLACKALVLLRDGSFGSLGGPLASVDPAVFNEDHPKLSTRDAQIDAIKKWYESNREALVWDVGQKRVVVRKDSLNPSKPKP